MRGEVWTGEGSHTVDGVRYGQVKVVTLLVGNLYGEVKIVTLLVRRDIDS